MILFGMILIVLGMYLLYIVSSKRIERTRHSSLKFATKKITVTRIIAVLLFFLAQGCFIQDYGHSIGLVSWWIFLAPLLFILILCINDLKSKKGVRK